VSENSEVQAERGPESRALDEDWLATIVASSCWCCSA
jgi:hypothetical protein